jgi:DNA-binding transcriptional ArsR family regulator
MKVKSMNNIIRTQQLDLASVKAAYQRIRALAHPLRLSMIQFIDKHGEINVNKIYHQLKLEQSITSQHLRILRTARLVTTRRDGKRIYYSVDYDAINELLAICEQLIH